MSSDTFNNYDLESIMNAENTKENLDKQKFGDDNVMSDYLQTRRHKRATPTSLANKTQANTKDSHLVEKRAVPNLYFTSPQVSSNWLSDSEEETPDYGFVGVEDLDESSYPSGESIIEELQQRSFPSHMLRFTRGPSRSGFLRFGRRDSNFGLSGVEGLSLQGNELIDPRVARGWNNNQFVRFG